MTMRAPVADLLRDRTARFQLYARVASAVVTIGGVAVLIGWVYGVRLLKRPFTPATMHVSTALAFVLSGVALACSTRPRARRFAIALGTAVVVLAGFTLGQGLGWWDLGLDHLLVPDAAAGAERMSALTAFCFMLLGMAIVVSGSERSLWIGHVLANAVALVAAVACLGYLYRVQALYEQGPFSRIAVHTAVLLLVLALGVLFAHPSAGLMPAIAGDTIGGTMARRLLPVAIVSPIAVGGLWLWGARRGFYSLEVGVSTVVVSMIVVLSIVIWWSAGDLLRVESERRAAEQDRARAVEETFALNEELNARVVERTTQLQAANKELEAFSYSVSHDLRAPLRHIDGFSKILLEDHSDSLEPRAQRYLTVIRGSAVTMGRMIDDLLQMARVDRRDLAFRETDLDEIVAQVVDEVRTDADGRVIEWSIEPLPTVTCDPGLVKIVFSNLLSNAVKYTRGRDPARIRVTCQAGTNPPVLVVQDNGAGFDPRYADKLFGVFQRLHRTEDFEGTGIGLATVQRIVQKHGGRVWADAAVDQGATFSFTLAAPLETTAVDSDTLKPGTSDASKAG